MNTIY
jgi:WD40 repeat protein